MSALQEARAQLGSLGQLVWNPASAMDGMLRAGYPWMAQSALLLADLVLITLAYEWSRDLALSGFPAEAVRAREAFASQMRLAWLIIAGATVLLWFVWWYAVAGILRLMAILITHRQSPFESMLPLAVLASVPLLARDAFALLILTLKETPRTARDLIPAIGLNLLPLQWPPYVWRLLNRFNLFELAALWLALYGFVRLTGAPARPAGLGLFGIWLAWSLIVAIPG